jgi:hypothetical protein
MLVIYFRYVAGFHNFLCFGIHVAVCFPMCWVRAAVFTKARKSSDGCLCTELQVIRSGQMDLSQFGIDPSKCKTWYSFIHSSRGNLSSYRRRHGQNRLVCHRQIAACGGFGRK